MQIENGALNFQLHLTEQLVHHVDMRVYRIQPDPETLLLHKVLKNVVLMLVKQVYHPVALQLRTKFISHSESKLFHKLSATQTEIVSFISLEEFQFLHCLVSLGCFQKDHKSFDPLEFGSIFDRLNQSHSTHFPLPIKLLGNLPL